MSGDDTDGPGPLTLPLDDPRAVLAVAGGKGASLSRLAREGLPVPPGFHVTTHAYRAYVDAHGLAGPIASALAHADPERAAREIQPMFTGRELPAAVRAAIVSAHGGLEAAGGVGVALAVRSSATAEDLPESSFAGQQESVLDVRGGRAVLDAVRCCWASLWSARAIAYRERLTAGLDDLALAVVVHRLVPADAAGVLFTADPTTGARDRTLVNAAWGLGESVVGGDVTPDTFTVSRAERAVVARRVGHKTMMTVRGPHGGTRTAPVPDALADRPAVSDAEILTLTDLGVRAETAIGAPADVEWAVQDGRCWLLQARPITHLPDDPAGTDEREGWNDSLTGDFLWTSSNLGEAIPDVMTPSTWSLVRIFMSEAMSLPGLGPYRLSGIIGGRFYLNLSMAMGVTAALGLARPARASLEQAFGRLPPDAVVPPLPLPRVTIIREALGAAVPFLRRVARYQRRLPELLADVPPRVTALRARIDAAPDPSALRGLWGELETLLRETSRMLAAGSRADGAGLVRIRPRLARLVGDDDVTALTTGLTSGSETLASLGPLLGLAAVRRGEMDRATFARTWGHRCPDEFEISAPRPAEDPGWLDAQLAAPLPADRDPETLLRRQADARDAAWGRLAAEHPHRARRTRRAIERAAHAARAREHARSEVVRTFGLLRAFVLRAGELTGRGEDLFFLGITEILAVLDGDDTAPTRVPARRRTYEWYRAIGPYPTLIRGSFDPERWAADPDRRHDLFDASAGAAPPPGSGPITGFAGAGGVVDGVARVLADVGEGDALRAGDVLVTTVTNIGWTPLFPRAAAVVTDVGAPLSHAAIVARELGIPAVVGCGDATTRLRSGDRVRVDGHAGTVTLLG